MKIVYAKSTTSVSNEHGVIYRLEGGQAWSASDPVVKTHPELFSDTPVKARTSSGWVETATANPGERRKSGR